MKAVRTTLLLWIFVFASDHALGRKHSPASEDLAAELSKAPAEAVTWQNPYEGQSGAILAGQKLFRRHCVECHGLGGPGRDNGPDLRSPLIQGAPSGVLFWFLKNGNVKAGMPSWSRLPEQQRWQLVTYLKTLK